MSDDEDGGAAALANKPEVEWLFNRLGNTLRLKPDKVLKMKQDETAMCVRSGQITATRPYTSLGVPCLANRCRLCI